MELSQYAETLRDELASITRFAGEDVARTAGLLAEALDSSVRLALLDVLTAAAAEITEKLGDTVVEVRLGEGEAKFVLTSVPLSGNEATGPPSDEGADDSGTSRITLRLPDALKTKIETAAVADGVSVNNWLVRAARRALEAPPGGNPPTRRRGPGQRITGFARG